jgi:hypothetical protein
MSLANPGGIAEEDLQAAAGRGGFRKGGLVGHRLTILRIYSGDERIENREQVIRDKVIREQATR